MTDSQKSLQEQLDRERRRIDALVEIITARHHPGMDCYPPDCRICAVLKGTLDDDTKADSSS